MWSKKRRRQRQSGIVIEEPPPPKASRKETTSGTTVEPVKNSSPAPPQPAPVKAEPGPGDAVGQCWDGAFTSIKFSYIDFDGRMHLCSYPCVFVQWNIRKKIVVFIPEEKINFIFCT